MFKFTQLGKRSLTVTLAFSMAFGPKAGLIAPQVVVSATETPVALNARGQNYRNLSLTPGADNSIMRFTWHSGSEEGSIRIWPLGQPQNYTILDTAAVVLESRMEGARNATTPLVPTRTGYEYFVHHASAYNLDPQTDFEYVVIWDNGESPVYTFRTGGSDNFSFLAAGDPQLGVFAGFLEQDGGGWQNTLDVATRNRNFDFLLSVGDQIHTTNAQMGGVTTSQARHDFLFAPSQFTSLPFVPVVGNHDGSGASNANIHMWQFHYNLPETAPNVRRFNNAENSLETQMDFYLRWGNMLLVQLDSNTTTGFGPNGPRTQWLEDVVYRNQDATWRVATYHHAVYPVFRFNHDGAGGNNAALGNVRANIVPVLENLEFDLILNGHEHAYSRSHQMLNQIPQLEQLWLDNEGNIVEERTNAVLDPTGIVHITLNSGSGSGYYSIQRMAHRPYIAAYNQNFRRNYTVVDVADYMLSVTTYQINNDGSTTLVDVYSIVRSENGQVPSNLRNLQTYVSEALETLHVAPVRDLVAGITFEELLEELPRRVNVETVIRNNREDNQAGMIRNPGDGDFGDSVSPAYANVIWDLESSAFDPAGEEQTFTVTGVADLTHVETRNGRDVRIENVNDLPLTVEVEVSIGEYFRTPELPNHYYISYFGARYRFYGRTAWAVMQDAFDPEAFALWEGGGDHPRGVPTPIGYGTPTGGSGISLDGGFVIPDGVGPHLRRSNNNPLQAGDVPHTATHFSRTFYLPEDFTPEQLGNVFGRHQIDDGMILFINGVNVYRMNTYNPFHYWTVPNIGTLVEMNRIHGFSANAENRTIAINYDFANRASQYYRSSLHTDFRMHHTASRTNLEQALRPGQNVVTAVILQQSLTMDDLWFNLELQIELLEPEVVVSSIAEARATELGETVTVRGIATKVYETAANNNNSFFLQDPNGTGPNDGIHVRLVPGNQALGVNYENGARNFVGHMVEVTGVRQRPTATNGFFGIDNVAVATNAATASEDRANNVRIIERDVAMPEPVAVSVEDLLAPAGASRPFSSMLVSLNEPIQLVDTQTTGPGNFPARAQDWSVGSTFDRPSTFTGEMPRRDGNSLIVNLTPMTALPQDLLAMLEASQGWVYVNRAAVHWWNGRNEIQLRVEDLLNGDITPATPPTEPNMSIEQLRGFLDTFLESFMGIDHAFLPNYRQENFTPESWLPFQAAIDGALALNQRYAHLPQQTVTIRSYFAALVEAAQGLERINHGAHLGLELAQVVRIVDGDTFVVNIDGRQENVRFLGIDTPENGETGFIEASAFVTYHAGPGTIVWMESEIDRDRDAFNRLLRYVWLEVPTDLDDEAQIRSSMLNAMLLEEGYATTLFIGHIRHEALFTRLASGMPELPPVEKPGDEDGYETPAAPTYPEWAANTAFDTGNRVTYNGRVFEAQWWTQNQNPANSGPWGAWMEIGNDVHMGYGVYAPKWTASRIFDNGDVVVYGGQIFRANWWTRNQSPTTQWGPWTHIGTVH